MIYFVVSSQENMEIAIGREIALENAITLLEKKNQEAIDSNLSMSCVFELMYEDNMIYQSSLSFPVSEFELYNLIKKDLIESNNNIMSQEIEEFLDFLLPFFPREDNHLKQIANKKNKAEKQKNEVKKTKEKKVKQSNPKTIKILAIFIGIILSIAVVFVGSSIVTNKLTTSKAVEKTTYQSLLKEENYLQIGKDYPNKIADVEELLNEKALAKSDKKAINQLIQFNEAYPTMLGDFDISILENDYKKVTTLYEANLKEFQKEDSRLVFVGYSYLKENNIKKAQEISEQIASVELEKKIFSYNQLSIEIEELEKELKELEKGGSKNKEKAETVANKKFDLMEKRLNL